MRWLDDITYSMDMGLYCVTLGRSFALSGLGSPTYIIKELLSQGTEGSGGSGGQGCPGIPCSWAGAEGWAGVG